jgi:hypothetical protein
MRNKDTRQKHHSFFDKTWFAFLMLAVIAGIIIYVWREVPERMARGLESANNAGTYGDSFGSVNALFTGLAFAGLVFSILLQQRQIQLQREDFLSQLEEMEDSRKTVERQNDLLDTQNRLMRAQIEAQLLQVEASAAEMESSVSAIRAQEYVVGAPQRKAQLDSITNRASVLQKRVGQVLTSSTAIDSNQAKTA